MNFLMILKVIAALGTAATGLLVFIKPSAAYGFTGLNVSGVRGISEMRAIFGGLLLALGLTPLFLGQVAYQTLGIGYLGIAITRLFSIFYDKSYASSNIISLVIEVVFGVILVL